MTRQELKEELLRHHLESISNGIQGSMVYFYAANKNIPKGFFIEQQYMKPSDKDKFLSELEEIEAREDFIQFVGEKTDYINVESEIY